MFNFSFSEVLLTLFVALIVFGPKKLPEVAEKFGRTLAKFRHSITEIKQEDSTEHK